MNTTTVIPSEPTPVSAVPLQHPSPSAPASSRVAVTRTEEVSPPVLAAGTGQVNLAAPHDPAACAGRACSRHHPSNHHMRTWPKVWRAFYGYNDRMCSHGVGHPDPDDVLDLQAVGGASTAHPCDGCCIAPIKVVS